MAKIAGIVVLVLFAVALIGGCSVLTWGSSEYNALNVLDQETNKSWAQVQNVYQRRTDLVPNLLNTVKGYAKHERGTFEAVINARAKATSVTIDPSKMTPQMFAAFQQTQGELSSALARLMVVVEQYPNLKADQHFSNLMTQLEGTENRITVERKRYNETAQLFNTKRNSFPTIILVNFVPWFAKYTEKPYFQAEEKAQKAPVVDFGTNGEKK